MRQRQPDGADLLPPRRNAVDDAARDDEVATGVVMAEREAEPVIVDRDDHSADGGGQSKENDQGRARCASARRRYHLFILREARDLKA